MQSTSSLTLRVSVKCAILTRERYRRGSGEARWSALRAGPERGDPVAIACWRWLSERGGVSPLALERQPVLRPTRNEGRQPNGLSEEGYTSRGQ